MFSPDGRWLCAPSVSSRPLRVGAWDEDPSLPTGDRVSFSADGRLLAGLAAGKAILYGAAGGLRLAQLELPHPANTWHSSFSPVGDRLVLSSNDLQTTYVWDLRRLRRELAELDLDWEAPPDPPAPAAASSCAGIPLQVHVDLGHLERPSPPAEIEPAAIK